MKNLFDVKRLAIFCLVLSLFTVLNLNAQTTCTWTGANNNSNWSEPNNWDANGVPGSTDIANIPHGLTNYPLISSDVTLKELRVYGEITLSSGRLSIGHLLIREGNVANPAVFYQTGGIVEVVEFWCNIEGQTNIFSASDGTIIFKSDSDGYEGSSTRLQYQTIQFHNVEIESGSTVDFDYNNKGNDITINISGNFSNYQTNPIIDAATFVFNGTGDQNIYSTGGDSHSTFGNLVSNKTSGKLVLLSDIDVALSFKDGDGYNIDENNIGTYVNLGEYMVSISGTALPVELTSFTAETNKNSVNLNWETATEVNNYGFEVQRSQDEAEWEVIGFVEGNGNSNSPKKYSYTDLTAGVGTYFYRLKQIDTDGAFEYFGPVTAELDAVEGLMLKQNYPNPFNPTTTITFGFDKNENARLTVYNVLGKEVAVLFNGKTEANKVYNVNFNASDLASGTYFYQIKSESSVETRKMNLVK